MRFTTVFILAIATAAPALASYSEFDARDDAWTGGLQARSAGRGQAAPRRPGPPPRRNAYYGQNPKSRRSLDELLWFAE
ncbi:hypothetical protein C8Q72DRAFT_869664 [Fomitopsis betulina]|nr:hypothetical protein C8Q72DRAFT_869664 [Fomitopsis betulina]